MPSAESRLAAVERQLRIHRAVIAGLLVGYGATEGVPEVVRARKFEAIDLNGVIASTLDAGGLEVTQVERSLFNKDEVITVKAVGAAKRTGMKGRRAGYG